MENTAQTVLAVNEVLQVLPALAILVFALVLIGHGIQLKRWGNHAA